MAGERGNQEIFNGYSLACDRWMKPNWTSSVVLAMENTPMMIYMLALAMTVAMLIATFFGLHQEAERVRLDDRDRRYRFGRRDRY
jgi:hypothetical protein